MTAEGRRAGARRLERLLTLAILLAVSSTAYLGWRYLALQAR
jgi:hypothetical protein